MATGCCENVTKYLLFFVNLILLISGLAILGFSIYALVDSKSASNTIESGSSVLFGENSGWTLNNIYTWVAIVFIVFSSLLIIISFSGCCGVWKENNCLLLVNFILLLIIFSVSIVGAVMLYFQNLDLIKPSLISSLKSYQPHPNEEVSVDPITSAWDDVQKQFTCCGVDGYQDWTNRSLTQDVIFPDSAKNFVPESCCWGIMEPETLLKCKKSPQDSMFQDRVKGCFSELQKTLVSHRDIIGIVTLTICGFIFVNLIAVFTFVLCVLPNSGYHQVHRA